MQSTSLGSLDRLTIDNRGAQLRLASGLHAQALPTFFCTEGGEGRFNRSAEYCLQGFQQVLARMDSHQRSKLLMFPRKAQRDDAPPWITSR